MRLFFYGTMLDPDVRRMVLGVMAGRLDIRPAVLPGFRRLQSRDGDYPVLARRTGSRVRGELSDKLSHGNLLRLMHFEGPDYLPSRQLVIDADGERYWACVLLPRRRGWGSGRAWDYRLWQLRRKPHMLPRLRSWMREFDRIGGHSVDISWRVRRRLRNWP